MSSGYTKLFSSITESTIWREPDATRLVWITMLALADADGYVGASVPGLADRARVSLDACLAALKTFMGPDEWSRTKELEGRRIAETEGGWVLLNHAKYRAIRDAEDRREQTRLAMQRLRAKGKAAVSGGEQCEPSEPPLAQTEAEADTETPRARTKAAPKGVSFDGIQPQVVADFKALRSRLRAPITETAMKGIKREAAKAGLDLESALVMCCERGWRGFKADWVHEVARGSTPTAAPSKARAALTAIFQGNAHDLTSDLVLQGNSRRIDKPVPAALGGLPGDGRSGRGDVGLD